LYGYLKPKLGPYLCDITDGLFQQLYHLIRCWESIHLYYYQKELEKKARQLYRKDMGLISPQDLKKYRAKLSLSQRNLAELTGLSPNTIALYEAGAFPTAANNNILKALIKNDQVLQQYLIDNSNQYSDELLSKINSYLKNENSIISPDKIKPKYTAVQLANWLLVENYFERECNKNIDPLSQMKVIKLLYFAYGRYLASTKNKLFSSPIIHLQYGPVVTEVHEKFKGQTVLNDEKIEKGAIEDYNTVSQDEEISELLHAVNQKYIDYTAAGLSKITHRKGSPWSLTQEKLIIKDQLIFDSFSKGREE